MDRSQLTQSKNPTSPTVSVRIHRRITRQHPRLHQHPHHKNQIATLLKRGNKNVGIKFRAHERFWNNLHQVAQDQKIGKPNNLIVLGAQELWVLMLCRSFFTPGRDIGSVVFMMWVLVQSGMLSCDSTVNTD
jgi:hypothetical protein